MRVHQQKKRETVCHPPVTVGTTTIAAGMTTAGNLLLCTMVGVLTGKVFLDAGVYFGALVVCAKQ